MEFIKSIKKAFLSINELLYYSAKRDAKHDYENVFLKSQNDITRLISYPIAKARILIIGCGYTYPDVILFSNICNYVVGIDVIGAFYRDGVIKTSRYIRNRESNIFMAFSKAMVRKYKYCRYYHYLKNISKVPIEHQKYNLFSYNGYQLPFKDESFDIVLSNAVLEHVEHVEELFQEMHRVTKKAGLSYNLGHNYYSFSGGHVAESLCLKYPWGHLQGKYETPPLNKLTPDKMQSYFSKYFDILASYQVDRNHRKRGVDSDFQFEREELLSERLKNDLGAFPRELLLNMAYLIIGRRKG